MLLTRLISGSSVTDSVSRLRPCPRRRQLKLQIVLIHWINFESWSLIFVCSWTWMCLHFRMSEKRPSDTCEGELVWKLHKMKFYRKKAHSWSLFRLSRQPWKGQTHYTFVHISPIPEFQHTWTEFYPDHPNWLVEFADIGCGYGGLLVQLSTMFPKTHMIVRHLHGY